MILLSAAKVLSCLIFLFTILAAYAGYVPPQVWAVPSILALCFPYLLIATVVIALAWLIWRKLWPTIVGGTTLLLVMPSALIVSPISMPKHVSVTDKTFTLITYNIYVLRNQESSDGVKDDAPHPGLKYLIDNNADIVCLQEMIQFPGEKDPESWRRQADILREMYPYRISDNVNNFMLLSKYPAVSGKVPSELCRNATLYHLRVEGKRLDIISTHLQSFMLSNDEREVVIDIKGLGSASHSVNKFKKEITPVLSDGFRKRSDDARYIRQLADSLHNTLIICGDFNDVPISWAYRKIRGNDISDAYADTGFGPLVTYNAHCFYFHIDHVLYRGGIEPLSVKKGKVLCSDHYPLKTEFRLKSD